MTRKPKVLFLCTGNSCRSQMAEGWARALKGDAIEAHSAGVEPHGLNAKAIQVMAEAGVDISGQSSKHVDALAHIPFDYVVTVCGHANETCPVFPGKTRVIHVGFDDPPALAKTAASEEEALNHYRRVRDEIRDWIHTLPEALDRTRLAAPRDKTRPGVLVMCVGNAARSQMAEGFLKARLGDAFDIHSAGMDPRQEIHPLAIRVMQEADIDIRTQWPKSTARISAAPGSSMSSSSASKPKPIAHAFSCGHPPPLLADPRSHRGRRPHRSTTRHLPHRT